MGAWVADCRWNGTELSLTVPIVNTLAFLFTVVGEWWVEGKVISRGMSPFSIRNQAKGWSVGADGGADTLLGMLLSVGGIALCVHSKNVS